MRYFCGRHEWAGEFLRDTQANTAGNRSTSVGLTLEKLEALMQSIPKPPPPPKYDIFPSAHVDKAYEINRSAAALAPLGCEDRRMIVAPMAAAWRWYTELREMGVDVRWQPRLSPQPGEDHA